MSTSSFNTLVDRYRSRGDDTPPVPYGVVASRIGISRQHLYNLLNGDQFPSPHIIARIAKLFGLKVDTVRRSLQESAKVGR